MSARVRAALSRTAGAAALIAAVTVLSRLLGFARTLVQNATVGIGEVADAYTAANALPNVLFEVAVGGALAGTVVPILAAPLARRARGDVDAISSALLGGTVALAVPLGAVLFVLADPIAGLVAGSADPGLVGDFLRVFAFQVPLYGLAVVLSGILQAQRRFFWPAFAPVLSSTVVVGCYVMFGLTASGAQDDAAALSDLAFRWLAWGTTAGVAALALPLLVPVRRSGVRLRPALRLAPGVGARARALAVAGIGALLAQQLAILVTLLLAQRFGDAGTYPVLLSVQALNLLPFAVLVVPLSTSVYPRLARRVATGEHAALARLTAHSARLVAAAAVLGTAALVASAPALAVVFVELTTGDATLMAHLATTLTWLAPGLVGLGLLHHLTRVLYALERGPAAVRAATAGWSVVVVAATAGCTMLVGLDERSATTTLDVLGGSTALGMLVGGGVAVRAVRRAAGAEAVVGLGRTLGLLAGAAAVAAPVGRAAGDAVLEAAGGVGVAGAVLAGVVGGAVASGLVIGVLAVGDRALVQGAWRDLEDHLDLEDDDVDGGARDRGADTPLPPAQRGDPTRVLLVVGRASGGIAEHCADLVRRLADDSAVEVAVLAHPFTADRVDLGPRLRRAWPSVRHPGAALGVLRLLRAAAKQGHVVHAQGHQAGVVAALALLGLSQPPLVITWHNAVLGGGPGRRLRAVAERLQVRRATLVTGASDDLVARARRLGSHEARLTEVPAPARQPWAGTRAAARAELAAELGRDVEGAWVLTVARVAPQKRLDIAVDAAGLLVGGGTDGGAGAGARGTHARDLLWLVAGEGDDAGSAALAARADALGAPVVLLGARHDVSRLMVAADVLVVTSDWEARALVVQEAMAAGTPVVVTAVGGLPGLVGEAGVQVSAGSPEEVARAVAGVLDDPERAARLGRAGRERAATWPDGAAAAAAWSETYVSIRGAAAPRS